MTAPLRGTQSLVGQMGWVFERRGMVALEIGWRWLFGVPFLAVCWLQGQTILAALPAEATGLNAIDTQNPWIAAVQIARASASYEPRVLAVLAWLAPAAAVAWVIVSGFGRSLVLLRMDPALRRTDAAVAPRLRPFSMMVLQAGWLALLLAVWGGWFRAMGWAAARDITAGPEPDLIGFACWSIFLSLGFFTLWALVSWPLSVAPIVMLLEECSAFASLGRSFRLGRAFTSKLVEINLVMGIVNIALVVLAMVFSAAPLPFGDELGAAALHVISAGAVVFYLVSSDYFQAVRLKGFVEFWKMFRGAEADRV